MPTPIARSAPRLRRFRPRPSAGGLPASALLCCLAGANDITMKTHLVVQKPLNHPDRPGGEKCESIRTGRGGLTVHPPGVGIATHQRYRDLRGPPGSIPFG